MRASSRRFRNTRSKRLLMPKAKHKTRMGRPPKEGARRHSIRVTDIVWRAYERFGGGNATRGIEHAAAWLSKLEGWTREQMARED